VVVPPCVLADTRLDGRGTFPVQVSRQCEVPDDAVAVVLTVTARAAGRNGSVALYPTGDRRPQVPTLRVGPDERRTVSTIVPVGLDGQITVGTRSVRHVVVGVTGAFVVDDATTSGRLVASTARKVLDTRRRTPLGAQSAVNVRIPRAYPADATAVLASVTVFDAPPRTHVTAHPPGSRQPDLATVTTDAARQTRSAMVIVPVTDGIFQLHVTSSVHVTIGVTGYFTGESAPETDDGLFVPIAPTVLADTRLDPPLVHRGGTREWPTLDRAPNARAVVGTVATERPVGAGHLYVHPARTPWRDHASPISLESNTVQTHAFIGAVSTRGLAVHATASTHVVVVVSGYFVGAPQSATMGRPQNAPPGPGRTLIVTDSTGAALRWYPQAQQDLTGYPWVLDAESCRRTAVASCRGREGYAPWNGVEAIRRVSGPIDTVVMMTGHNDWHTSFPSAIDQVMAAARAKGVRQVVWLVLRTDHVYSMPGQVGGSATNHSLINGHLRAARVRHPDLELIDWATHSRGRTSWFFGDRLHITPLGAQELARFISAQLMSISL
jgi:hypothetical protein